MVLVLLVFLFSSAFSVCLILHFPTPSAPFLPCRLWCLLPAFLFACGVGRAGGHNKPWGFTCFPASWTCSAVCGGWSDPAPLLHKYCGCFAETRFEHRLVCKKNHAAFPFPFCFLQTPLLHTPFGFFFQLCSFARKNFATESLICLYFLLSICIWNNSLFLLLCLRLKLFLHGVCFCSCSIWKFARKGSEREKDQGNMKELFHTNCSD